MMINVINMNLLLHGIENPDIINQDSLSESSSNDKEIYDTLQPNNSFWVKDTKDTKLVLETLLKEWK